MVEMVEFEGIEVLLEQIKADEVVEDDETVELVEMVELLYLFDKI